MGRDKYIHFYDIENVWDLDELRRYEKYALQDIEQIKKYIEDIYKQAQVAAVAEMRPEITVERSKNYKGKVYIYISAKMRPVIDGVVSDKHYLYLHSDGKRFDGNQRKQALEYAANLGRKYNTAVTKIGF